MESNEQNELTRKTGTDSQMESRMTASVCVEGGRLRGGGIEQKGKRTHGHGDCEVGEGGGRR